MMAKMKSLWASGSQDHFSRLAPSPTPSQPPEARENSPWLDCQACPMVSGADGTGWPWGLAGMHWRQYGEPMETETPAEGGGYDLGGMWMFEKTQKSKLVAAMAVRTRPVPRS